MTGVPSEERPVKKEYLCPHPTNFQHFVQEGTLMNNELHVPRDFKGIWIPREIWLHPELLPLEKLVWAEIHSLYNREKGGCYAKNDYLAKFFGVGETYISKVISKLKKLGFVEEIHFNGRQRVIRAVLPPEDFGQCKADLHCSATQTCTAEQVRPEPECNPPIYIENKEKNKERESKGAAPPTPLSRSPVSSSFSKTPRRKSAQGEKLRFGKHENVEMTQADYEAAISEYGKTLVDRNIAELDVWIGRGKAKGERDHYLTLLAFIRREKENQKEKNNANPKQDVRKRQLDEWAKDNGDPNENPNILRFD